MRDWQNDAPIFIERATKDLSETATLQERRSALRKVRGEFHCGTSWGKKVWAKHCRQYLQKHGLPPKSVKDSPRFADDIMFPFRGESDK